MKYILFLYILLFLSFTVGASDGKGLLPVNKDGFETGDWRNFRPHYIGDAEDWIRPNFVINDTDPINGDFSLQWSSDERTHQWLMLSNAFYLKKPLSVSVDFRIQGETNSFAAGLLVMESQEQYAGIKVSEKGSELFIKGSATIDKPGREMNVVPGVIYRMSVSLEDDHIFKTEVLEIITGRVVSSFQTISHIDPVAISMYVRTGGGAGTTIDFDDLTVNASDYLVPAGRYVRSPHYVVLPRLPDAAQDQGNWVGGQSTMIEDGIFKMWYRIRDNKERGRGYGFAKSMDGLNFEKYENNPIFTHGPEFTSNEKICVLKVDGLYRAWYAVDTGKGWYMAHATSGDGISWKQHGLVMEDPGKDAPVIFHNDTYYLYSIKDWDKIGVYTSSNGIDFTHRNTIEIGMHAHVAAFYEKKTGLFHLYSTGGHNGVNHAVSNNGIDFGFFTNVWNPPAVGLDDWDEAGITYLTFVTDGHGHIDDAATLPVYYQARNTWNNNIPSWNYHGGERVVLAGKYEGIYIGVATRIKPDGASYYESFPFMIPKADGLSFAAMRPIRVVVNHWDRQGEVTASGTIEAFSENPGKTQVQLKAQKLIPEKKYQLLIDQNNISESVADKYGNLLFTFTIDQNKSVVLSVLRQ